MLLLTFWPAVEDDDKKVRVTLRVPFDTQVRTILFFIFLVYYKLGLQWSLLSSNICYHQCCWFQVAGIILAAIFLVHGLLAVGFKVCYTETFIRCLVTKLSLSFSKFNGLAQLRICTQNTHCVVSEISKAYLPNGRSFLRIPPVTQPSENSN